MHKENKRTPKNAGEKDNQYTIKEETGRYNEWDWLPISFLIVCHW